MSPESGNHISGDVSKNKGLGNAVGVLREPHFFSARKAHIFVPKASQYASDVTEENGNLLPLHARRALAGSAE